MVHTGESWCTVTLHAGKNCDTVSLHACRRENSDWCIQETSQCTVMVNAGKSCCTVIATVHAGELVAQ